MHERDQDECAHEVRIRCACARGREAKYAQRDIVSIRINNSSPLNQTAEPTGMHEPVRDTQVPMHLEPGEEDYIVPEAPDRPPTVMPRVTAPAPPPRPAYNLDAVSVRGMRVTFSGEGESMCVRGCLGKEFVNMCVKCLCEEYVNTCVKGVMEYVCDSCVYM